MTGNSTQKSAEKLFLAAAEKGDKKMLVDALERFPELDINCEDCEGRSALVISIMAGNTDVVAVLLERGIDVADSLLQAVDIQIIGSVSIILDHLKGKHLLRECLNCHSLNGDLHPDITPIILAAHHNNYDIIKLLLDNGANIDDPEFYTFKTEQFTLQHSLGLINVYKALASQAYIALTSADPIDTAFELGQKLHQLSKRDYEFRNQYQELADQCEQFASDLLGKVRDSDEQAIVLNHDPEEWLLDGSENKCDEPYKVKRAIKCEQKKFVAHPHCQQHLIEGWYRGLPNWRQQGKVKTLFVIIVIFFCLPVLCLSYVISPENRASKLLRIPYLRFVCHTSSSVWFLVLLGLQAVDWEGIDDNVHGTPDHDKWAFVVKQQQRVSTPSFTEILIIFWILGLTWQECRTLWKKGAKSFMENFQWKVFDFITLSLYWGWIALRVTVTIQEMNRGAGGLSSIDNNLDGFYHKNLNFSFFEQYSEGYFQVPMSDYDSSSSQTEEIDSVISLDSYNDSFTDMDDEDEFEGSATNDLIELRIQMEHMNHQLGKVLTEQKKLESNLTGILTEMTEKMENINEMMESYRVISSQRSTGYPSTQSSQTTRFRGMSSGMYGSQSMNNLEPSARKRWDAFDPVLISEGLFAMAKVLTFLRVIRITVVSMHVGPMQISLGRMMMDIVKFLMIFSLVWFAFSLGLNQLYWYYSFEMKLDCKVRNETQCSQPFGTIPDALNTLFWALFGVSELVSLDIKGADHWFTESVGRILFAAYHVIGMVVLLNVLIAMMSNTYTKVEEDADIQWKYARSRLWVSFFGEGQTVPPPFNVLPSLKCIIDLFKRIRLRMAGKKIIDLKTRKQSMLDIKSKEYQEVVQRLVRRYMFDRRRVGDEDEAFDPVLMQVKQDITGFKYDMFETLSNMDDKMQIMQTRMNDLETIVTSVRDQSTPGAGRGSSPPPTPRTPSPMPPDESTEETMSTVDVTEGPWEEMPSALLPLYEWGHISYIDEVSSLGSRGSRTSFL
ncbi:short transient receptor potential channel 7-like [Saccoglossus kowalevskii]